MKEQVLLQRSLAAAAAEEKEKKSLGAERRVMRRTKHDHLLPYFKEQIANTAENLVPIRLDLDFETFKLKDVFMWNIKEKYFTPQKFAEMLCEDLDIGNQQAPQFVAIVTEAISAQLEEYKTNFYNEIPPDEDMRFTINLDIQFNNHVIHDRFEWDLASPLTPEEFAKTLAADLGLGGEFPSLVSHSIHEQIYRARMILANNLVSLDDDGDLVVGMLKDTIGGARLRGGDKGDVVRDTGVDLWDWGPVLEGPLNREGVEKLVAEKEREKAALQSKKNRRDSRGSALSRRRSTYNSSSDLDLMIAAEAEASWTTPDERQNWSCTHCGCPGKSTNMPRSGPRGPKTLCHSCGE
ncbi:Chromatin structure remodeling complex protein sfh1 [Blyttiomyces sp. JEL0837]|nr:Chromatin structure remodeling complex protein sfh1 [Blyttiomyces sp. JEL0837]